MIKDCASRAYSEANKFVETVDQHLKVLNKNGWHRKIDMDAKVKIDNEVAQAGLAGAALAILGAAFAATLAYDAIKLGARVVVFVVSLVNPQNPFLRTAIGVALFVSGHEVMVLAKNINYYRDKQATEGEFIRVAREGKERCFIFLKECFQSACTDEPGRAEGAEGQENGVRFPTKAKALAHIFTDGLIISKLRPNLIYLFEKYIAADNHGFFKKIGIETQ